MYTMFTEVENFSMIKMLILPILIYKFSVIHVQIPAGCW